MSKALPRLEVLLEEGPRPPRAAPNIAAALPATASHGAFVAVASQAVQKPGATGLDGMLTSPPAAPPALLQLHIYALAPPPPAVKREAAQAPDMMLLHSVRIYEDDLQWLSSHDAARRAASTSATTSPAAAEADAVGGTAWVGPRFTVDGQQPAPRHLDTSPPAMTTVEAVAWVGLEFVAVKTGQRQLLLVSSGLRPSTGATASSSDDEGDDEMDLLHAGVQRERSVRTGFARVQDFCTTTTTTAGLTGGGAAAESVLIVAGLQRLVGVVCGGDGGISSTITAAATPAKARAPPPVTEHVWKLGPFQHVSATAAAATPSGIVLCAASAAGSVEVYTWCVHVAHRATPPVCVHQVLMTAGTHVFYGVAVSAPVTTSQQEICFWVLGGERADVRDTEVEGGSSEMGGRSADLPALRGIDGRVFQVQPTSSAAPKPLRRGATEDEVASTGAGPRVLNTLWSSASKSAAMSADHLSLLPALSALEALPSLRLGVPPLLLAADNAGVDGPPQPRGHTLKTRFVLAVRGAVDGARPHWISAVLPLDSPNCAAVFAWLGATPSAAEVPSWTLLDAAVTRNTHELTLCTGHRVLQLCVRRSASLPTADAGGSLEVDVQGTHEVTDGQRLVGLATVPGCGEATPLLLLCGTVTPVPTAEPRAGSDAVSSVYSQPLRKASWAVATDLRAAILHQLQPWTPVRGPGAPPHLGSDTGCGSAELGAPASEAALLAKVEALVAAEGARLQQHLDERLDRLEALLQRLANSKGDGEHANVMDDLSRS